MIWLGDRRGNLSDWTTQQWVRFTGRRVSLAEHPWLNGPAGNTRGIGKGFFESYAQRYGLEVVAAGARGLVPNFSHLEAGRPELCNIAYAVKEFYERTSEFDLDVWSEWHTLFRPFGNALSFIFSRRRLQLNVPLSSLDSSRGMSSEVIQLRDSRTDTIIQTAWVRELHATKNVIYAGSYSTCIVPGHPHPCVKVVFPLPNGNAIVLMKTEGHADGSLSLRSAGKRFGDPGFYFVLHQGNGTVWARYVPSFKEEIRVYPAESGTVRADHTLWIWGKKFLRLHYRMRRQ